MLSCKKKKKRVFAIPADHRLKMKEIEKILGSFKRAKKTDVKNESDSDAVIIRAKWKDLHGLGKKTREIENQRKNQDQPDHSSVLDWLEYSEESLKQVVFFVFDDIVAIEAFI